MKNDSIWRCGSNYLWCTECAIQKVNQTPVKAIKYETPVIHMDEWLKVDYDSLFLLDLLHPFYYRVLYLPFNEKKFDYLVQLYWSEPEQLKRELANGKISRLTLPNVLQKILKGCFTNSVNLRTIYCILYALYARQNIELYLKQHKQQHQRHQTLGVPPLLNPNFENNDCLQRQDQRTAAEYVAPAPADTMSLQLKSTVSPLYQQPQKETQPVMIEDLRHDNKWPSYDESLRTYESISFDFENTLQKSDNFDQLIVDSSNNTAHDAPQYDVTSPLVPIGARVRIHTPRVCYGRVVWNWRKDDLFCIQLDTETVEQAKTYHVKDKRWDLQVLSAILCDLSKIPHHPPLQLVMAEYGCEEIPMPPTYKPSANHGIFGTILHDKKCVKQNTKTAQLNNSTISISQLCDAGQHGYATRSKRALFDENHARKHKTARDNAVDIVVHGPPEDSIFYHYGMIQVSWTPKVWISLESPTYRILLLKDHSSENLDTRWEYELDLVTNGSNAWRGMIPDHVVPDDKYYIAVCTVDGGDCGFSNGFQIRHANSGNVQDIHRYYSPNRYTNHDIHLQGKKINHQHKTNNHSCDNGVFCPCGSTKFSNEEDIFVQCYLCRTWQHAKHVGYSTLATVPLKYLCPWCEQSTVGWQNFLFPELTKIQTTLHMLLSSSNYYRKKNVVFKDNGTEKYQSMSVDQMRHLCIQRGLQFSGTKLSIECSCSQQIVWVAM